MRVMPDTFDRLHYTPTFQLVETVPPRIRNPGAKPGSLLNSYRAVLKQPSVIVWLPLFSIAKTSKI